MYQENIQSQYNRHYGKSKPGELDSPSKMLLRNKRMLEEDSEDEFISSKLDGEQKLKEQKLGRVLFLVTFGILLVNLVKSATSSFQTPNPRQWLSELKFPELGTDWWPEDGGKLLYPVLWGIGVSVMSWIVIYFDSKAPGVDPRLPSRSLLLNPLTWPLAYWTSLFCGLFVFLTVSLLQY